MNTCHIIIIGDSQEIYEIPDNSIHLVVTSPPYFNAPFDYKNFYNNYDEFLEIIRNVAKELFRVIKEGRILVLNIDDMLVDGKKYPIVADATKIFQSVGFNYRDRIIWKKPDDYLRILKRREVIYRYPYPMYFYPDNLVESFLIFQKGKFDYFSVSREKKLMSKIDLQEFNQKKLYMTLWEIRNVMPGASLEKGIAAFPEEIPYRFIKLFSYVGETVLDPFLGSGTTMKVARELGRNSIGIEINKSLLLIIKKKIGFKFQKNTKETGDSFFIINRN